MNLNFDLFQAPEIRDLLKTRAHLLRAGCPAEHQSIHWLNRVIAYYRRQVGLETYLSQMLGDIAAMPVMECRIYWADGEAVEVEPTQQPVQRWLAGRFREELPFRVVAAGQERYL